jgi:hypothetical protein
MDRDRRGAAVGVAILAAVFGTGAVGTAASAGVHPLAASAAVVAVAGATLYAAAEVRLSPGRPPDPDADVARLGEGSDAAGSSGPPSPAPFGARAALRYAAVGLLVGALVGGLGAL